jgi:hypothetical protein
MFDEVVAIQYPEGEYELRIGFAHPRLGDTFKRRGAEWVVTQVESRDQGPIAISVMAAQGAEPAVASHIA